MTITNNLCACKSEEDHNLPKSSSGQYTWYSEEPIFDGNHALGWNFQKDQELWEVFPHLKVTGHGWIIKGNPIEAAADFYLLDAIQSGLLGRDVIPTDFTDKYLWRRQKDHPFNETGLKLCGCPVGTETLTAPCPHDGRISEFSWHLFRGTHEMPNHFAKPIQKAERLQNQMIHEWAAIFWSYGALAFASELAYLRESQKVGRRARPTMGDVVYDRSTLVGAFAALERSFGPESWAEHVPHAFMPDNAGWGGSYGGEAWESCALQYKRLVEERIEPKIFVDRVFSLQHNTSTFLNKVNWATKMPDETATGDPHWVDLYGIRYVLNAHAESDYRTLLNYASDKIKRLWERYWDHVQYERVVMRNLPAAVPEGTW